MSHWQYLYSIVGLGSLAKGKNQSTHDEAPFGEIFVFLSLEGGLCKAGNALSFCAILERGQQRVHHFDKLSTLGMVTQFPHVLFVKQVSLV